MVVGVPDSSLSAAMGYSEESGLPFEMGLIKTATWTHLHSTHPGAAGQRRQNEAGRQPVGGGGETAGVAGRFHCPWNHFPAHRPPAEGGWAREVHLRIASPPLRYPCFYGVDISTQEELISARLSVPELCRFVGGRFLRFPDRTGDAGGLRRRGFLLLPALTGGM